MTDRQMPDDEIRPCPEVIEHMIKLVSENHSAPAAQNVDIVRRKLQQIPFSQLLTLWFKWMWGDNKDSIHAWVERDLYPA